MLRLFRQPPQLCDRKRARDERLPRRPVKAKPDFLTVFRRNRAPALTDAEYGVDGAREARGANNRRG